MENYVICSIDIIYIFLLFFIKQGIFLLLLKNRCFVQIYAHIIMRIGKCVKQSISIWGHEHFPQNRYVVLLPRPRPYEVKDKIV